MTVPQPPDPEPDPTAEIPPQPRAPVVPRREEEPSEEELAAQRFRQALAPAMPSARKAIRGSKPGSAAAPNRSAPANPGVLPMPPKQALDRAQAQAGAVRPFGQPRRLHEDEIPRAAPIRFGVFSVLFGLLGFLFRLGLATVLILGIAFAGGYYVALNFIQLDEVVVPSVRGMKIESAFESLSDKNLAVIRERTEASALVAPGEIIEQRPAPGIKTKRGSTVRLVISSGRANFVVPNVVGESRENAINKIRGARFELGNVLYLEDDLVPRDYVISQTPEAGKGMDFAGRVDLALSAGPRGTGKTMPLVTGRSLAEARTVLSVAGITDVVTEPEGAAPNAIVTSQEPPGGAMMVTGARVVLRVAP